MVGSFSLCSLGQVTSDSMTEMLFLVNFYATDGTVVHELPFIISIMPDFTTRLMPGLAFRGSHAAPLSSFRLPGQNMVGIIEPAGLPYFVDWNGSSMLPMGITMLPIPLNESSLPTSIWHDEGLLSFQEVRRPFYPTYIYLH